MPQDTETPLCYLPALLTHQHGPSWDEKNQIVPYLMHTRNSSFGFLMVYE